MNSAPILPMPREGVGQLPKLSVRVPVNVSDDDAARLARAAAAASKPGHRVTAVQWARQAIIKLLDEEEAKL